jgi:hypothetical protein
MVGDPSYLVAIIVEFLRRYVILYIWLTALQCF